MLGGAYGRKPDLDSLGVVAGEAVLPHMMSVVINVAGQTGKEAYFHPFILPPGFVCDQLGYRRAVGQASAAARLGLYTHNRVTGRPDQLIFGSAEQNNSGAAADVAIAISPAIALPQIVWGCWWQQAAATGATTTANAAATGQNAGMTTALALGASRSVGWAVFTTSAWGGALPQSAASLGTLARLTGQSRPCFYLRRA